MIPELGHYALMLALGLALMQGTMSVVGVRTNPRQAPLLAVQPEEMLSNPVREAQARSVAKTAWHPDRPFTIPTIARYARNWRFI